MDELFTFEPGVCSEISPTGAARIWHRKNLLAVLKQFDGESWTSFVCRMDSMRDHFKRKFERKPLADLADLVKECCNE